MFGFFFVVFFFATSQCIGDLYKNYGVIGLSPVVMKMLVREMAAGTSHTQPRHDSRSSRGETCCCNVNLFAHFFVTLGNSFNDE